jgi:hypothetical protein
MPSFLALSARLSVTPEPGKTTMPSSLGDTAPRRRRWRTTATETKNAAAISSSDFPFSRSVRNARNWSSGWSGARWILGKTVFLGEPFRSHHARDRGVAGEPFLLDQQFERPEAAAAGRNLEHPGLSALIVEDRPDDEALQQCAAGDVFGKPLD